MARSLKACALGEAALSALLAAVAAVAGVAAAAPLLGSVPDQVAGAWPAEGEVIRYGAAERLRGRLPRALWNHRHYLFYRNMSLEIGPAQRDYAPPPAYREATGRFAGQATIGPDGEMLGYRAGQPFPMDSIDCANDPAAGAKIMWNHAYAWEGDGDRASFRLTHWDRGERLPTFYEGRFKSVQLAHRVEPALIDAKQGDLFRGERRKSGLVFEVDAPRAARGIRVLSHRFKTSDGPRAEADADQVWIFLPGDRQVMRVHMKSASDALPGTSMVLEELRGFSGIVPEYRWSCLAETEVLAPVNSRVEAYPYVPDHDFGPLGLSFASDRWERRRAVVVQMVPRSQDHHLGRKELVIDRQTLRVLYTFAYDRKNELWKISLHNGRWSEDGTGYYPGWDGVPQPRDAKTVADITINVQTDTGTRLEYWDNDGTPLGRGDVRRLLEPHMRRVH